LATEAGLDGCGKSLPLAGIGPPDRPVRSESLYRLRYPDPPLNVTHYENEGLVVLYTVMVLLLNYCK
jgi:hypothetical protein